MVRRRRSLDPDFEPTAGAQHPVSRHPAGLCSMPSAAVAWNVVCFRLEPDLAHGGRCTRPLPCIVSTITSRQSTGSPPSLVQLPAFSLCRGAEIRRQDRLGADTCSSGARGGRRGSPFSSGLPLPTDTVRTRGAGGGLPHRAPELPAARHRLRPAPLYDRPAPACLVRKPQSPAGDFERQPLRAALSPADPRRPAAGAVRSPARGADGKDGARHGPRGGPGAAGHPSDRGQFLQSPGRISGRQRAGDPSAGPGPRASII